MLQTNTMYQASSAQYWPNNAIAQIYAANPQGSFEGCTGTWVSGYDVLTAAHCLSNWTTGESFSGIRIRTAMNGYAKPYGTLGALYVSWYRAEYLYGNQPNGVNYYDIALIRVTTLPGGGGSLPYHSYMGFKYDCAKKLYRAGFCAYPGSGFSPWNPFTQWCCDFTVGSSTCQPGARVPAWCTVVPGQSGGAMVDLEDQKIVGVLSGRRNGTSYTSYYTSYWTPITAQHFAALRSWMYTGGDPRAGAPPAPPSPPPPAPVDVSRYECSSLGQVRLVPGSLGTGAQGNVEICLADTSGKRWWSNICSKAWGYSEAEVVCRQLQIPGRAVPASSFFGPQRIDQKFFWVSNVSCGGNEQSLADCTMDAWGNLDSCVPAEVAGVVCNATLPGSNSTNGHVDEANDYADYPCTTDWAVRLNGTSSGRVEVCLNGTWGSVCDDQWDDQDASVACSQLGFTAGVAAPRNGGAAAPPGMRIWLSQLNCTGNEGNFSACQFGSPVGRAACTHNMDAWARCANSPLLPSIPYAAPTCSSMGAIRLARAADVAEPANAEAAGRVELCYKSRWGSICADSSWSAADAQVICWSLGYRHAVTTYTNDTNNEPTWARFASCLGTENDFTRCLVDGWGSKSCGTSLRAAVACSNSTMPAAPPPPASNFTCNASGAVRLAGANAYNNTATGTAGGRVEYCYNGMWGTVCQDNFTATEARVICRSLGYGYGGAAKTGQFGRANSSQPVWLNYLDCVGNEASLSECYKLQNLSSTTLGWSGYVGPVQIAKDGADACAAHNSDLTVTCSKGYIPPPPAPPPPPPDLPLPPSSPWAAPPLRPSAPWPSERCAVEGGLRLVTADGVMDQQAPPPDGSVNTTGLLQVCHGGMWGVVCSNRFGRAEADVACRQLGFGAGVALPQAEVEFQSLHGVLAGPVWMDGVVCQGAEGRLVDCAFPGWDYWVGTCSGGNDPRWDAAITCFASAPLEPPQPPPWPPAPQPAYSCRQEGSLRVLDQNGAAVRTTNVSQVQGALHICLRGSWSFICDNSWSVNDASVACRSLGFATAYASYTWPALRAMNWTDAVRPADLPPGISRVSCRGYEDGLLECDAISAGSDPRCLGAGSVAGIWCNSAPAPPPSPAPPTPPGLPPRPAAPPSPRPPPRGGYSCVQDGDLRLVDGPSPLAGRLEICHNGVWGTICNPGWTDKLMGIACRQVVGSPAAVGSTMTGFSTRNPRFQAAPQTATVWTQANLFEGLCYGNESRLADCIPDEAWINVTTSVSGCNHRLDVGVVCWPSADAVVTTPVLTRPPYTCSTDRQIRLVNGSTPGMGRVEVCLGGQWGAVCAGGWNNTVAAAVCRGLGYRGGGYVNNLVVSTSMCYDPINCRPNLYGLPGVNQSVWIWNSTCPPGATSLWGCNLNTTMPSSAWYVDAATGSCTAPARVVCISTDYVPPPPASPPPSPPPPSPPPPSPPPPSPPPPSPPPPSPPPPSPPPPSPRPPSTPRPPPPFPSPPPPSSPPPSPPPPSPPPPSPPPPSPPPPSPPPPKPPPPSPPPPSPRPRNSPAPSSQQPAKSSPPSPPPMFSKPPSQADPPPPHQAPKKPSRKKPSKKRPPRRLPPLNVRYRPPQKRH